MANEITRMSYKIDRFSKQNDILIKNQEKILQALTINQDKEIGNDVEAEEIFNALPISSLEEFEKQLQNKEIFKQMVCNIISYVEALH